MDNILKLKEMRSLINEIKNDLITIEKIVNNEINIKTIKLTSKDKFIYLVDYLKTN